VGVVLIYIPVIFPVGEKISRLLDPLLSLLIKIKIS
jgi:hypothetical protein